MLLAGCAPAISTTLAREAGAPVNFADLQAHPERYQGRLVILGGDVMTVQPKGQGSLLTVSQLPLDAGNHPIYGAPSGGTFLVESQEWLPSYEYVPKRKVTVAGEVVGRQDGSPLLKARQIHLWEYPPWEKYYYPVPREWYNYDKNLEFWFTPPYFNPYRNHWGG
jgi:outer membrane lipoprotein